MTYLDYAATFPIWPEVREAMHEAEEKYFANASALHTPGHTGLNEVEKCRKLLAKMINAEPDEIIFTSGSTEANNTVIRTFEGHEIETSPLEHHSILEAAEVYRGKKLPKLYSYMFANNETGEFLELPKLDLSACLNSEKNEESACLNSEKTGVNGEKEAYLHSDMTQVLGKIPIDVKKLKLDYATFSAHKIGGPIGVGALYVRNGALFKPLLIGGNQEKKRRGGTYNTVGIVGFKRALELIEEKNLFRVYDTKVRSLRGKLAERILEEIPDSSLNMDLKRSLPNILNVSFKAAEGESIQLYLDAERVIVSTGSACASGDIRPSHVLMAKTGDAEIAHSSIRFSFGPENTEADVEKVMEVLPGIIKRLQGMSTIFSKNIMT